MLIPVWRLPSPHNVNVWATREQLSKEMVSLCLHRGLIKTMPLLPEEDHSDEMLHGMRIAYFVTHGFSDPVEAVVQETDQGEEYLHCEDGCHRIGAALYLGVGEVLAVYNKDVHDFLTNEVM